MRNIKPCINIKMLINALNIMRKSGHFITITDIELVESDSRAMSKIIRLGCNVSEDCRENWNGEYFIDYDFFIAIDRNSTIKNAIPNDKYRVIYGYPNNNNVVECQSKEEAELKYKEIRDEELLLSLQNDELIQSLREFDKKTFGADYTYQEELQEYGISDESNHVRR